MDRTQRGTLSIDDGRFALRNIPTGNYRLVVSYVGYHTVSVPLNEQSTRQLTIEMQRDEQALNEVVIKQNDNFEEYFGLFKMFFLGNNGLQCTIKNPRALTLDYDRKTYMLTGRARQPLVIENQFLGYRVYYDLTSFSHYPGRTSYTGFSHFEVLQPADSKQANKWKANRENAYLGSFNQFMQSMVDHRLKEDGFVLKKLAKTKSFSGNHPVVERWTGNEHKAPDTLISLRWNGIDYEPQDTTILGTTAKIWGSKAGYNVLFPQPVLYDSILVKTYNVGRYLLNFSNSLFVTYKNKKISNAAPGYGGNSGQPVFPISILSILKPKTSVDTFGNLADPNAVIHEGYWATLRVADQLPDDYRPEATNTGK